MLHDLPTRSKLIVASGSVALMVAACGMTGYLGLRVIDAPLAQRPDTASVVVVMTAAAIASVVAYVLSVFHDRIVSAPFARAEAALEALATRDGEIAA